MRLYEISGINPESWAVMQGKPHTSRQAGLPVCQADKYTRYIQKAKPERRNQLKTLHLSCHLFCISVVVEDRVYGEYYRSINQKVY